MIPLLRTTPPTGLVLLAIVGVQLGAVIAIGLFDRLGADGTVAARIVLAAGLLVLLTARRLPAFGAHFKQHWMVLLTFGLCIAVMNFFFYQAISRIPLGAAVAIEFAGPLAVAAFTSRRLIQLACVALAALGIILLSPFTGADLNTQGVVFAFMAGGAWALFILLAGIVNKRLPEHDGLVIAMVVAAVVMLPLLVPVIPSLVGDAKLLMAAIGVAILSTALPFVLEFEALRRLSPRVYGVLVSLEPAFAALAGLILLKENIGIRGALAVACVVIAAVGISLTERTSAALPRDL